METTRSLLLQSFNPDCSKALPVRLSNPLVSKRQEVGGVSLSRVSEIGW